MKKTVWIGIVLCVQMLWSVDISMTQTPTQEQNISEPRSASMTVFGENLFNGSFANVNRIYFNPDYRINIGDTISIKMWGAYDAELAAEVDAQGNIFIPKVGTVELLGSRNNEISDKIKRAVQKVYKHSVYVYANLQNYQPVSIFVTGSVNKPGLYEGLSSDSVIQFLDKARGISLEDGSFRDIAIMRNDKIIKKVDLYDFIRDGKMGLFQFRNGDVILVGSVHDYVTVEGDVKRPYRFELKGSSVALSELNSYVLPDETATNVLITSWNGGHDTMIASHPLRSKLTLHSGDNINYFSDYNTDRITVTVDGEHLGRRKLVLQKGTTLSQALEQIQFSPLSNKKAVQLYRESIAALQKQLLDSQLRDLETKTLTTGSVTTEEATIRQQEASMILSFIDRAKKIQPKGRVVLNDGSDFKNVILENEDTIYVPKKSNIITIQGEVKLPGAQTFVQGRDAEDYIDACGGFNYRADTDNVLLVHPNGHVVSFDVSSYGGSEAVWPGDSLLVLGKPDSKSLQIVKDITQIIYQIAVGAAVVLRAY